MQSSHSLRRLHTTFDDHRLIADAGLVLPATLMQRLQLQDLFNTHVELGDRPGAANVGRKALTLLASLLGRRLYRRCRCPAGGCDAVLGHKVAAPSTLGTFLRSCSWGHARQFDVVSRRALARAWDAGAGPGDKLLTIDMDATICETHGILKEGASEVTYTKVRGYHPLLAVAAGLGDICHGRLRGGRANSGRGAAGFVTETIQRVRAAGATGPITLRADAGFYSHEVVRACERAGVHYSITVKAQRNLKELISAIPEAAWVPIPCWIEGGADVAEIPYLPFADRGRREPVRLLVRRVRPVPGSQLDLFGEPYTYHAFITNRDEAMLELEADHRRHADVENVVRDLKYGMGLNHLPSGRFGANAAWLALNLLAHNLARWLCRLGLGGLLACSKTLRRRLFALPGRLTRSGRGLWLHLPAQWPWAKQFTAAWQRLQALRVPLLA